MLQWLCLFILKPIGLYYTVANLRIAHMIDTGLSYKYMIGSCLQISIFVKAAFAVAQSFYYYYYL